MRRLQLDHRLRRRFDSSDLIQETFARAFSRLDQFRGGTEAEAFKWLQRILRTVTLNSIEREETIARDFRREQPLQELLDDSSGRLESFLGVSTPAPDDRVARFELMLELAVQIEKLAPDQRDVVNLRDIHGYRVAEIAGLLGKSEKAIAGLLLRGHLKLRECAKLLGLEPL